MEKILIGGLYRIPSSSCDILVDALPLLLSFFAVSPKSLWACGFALGRHVVGKGHPGCIPGVSIV